MLNLFKPPADPAETTDSMSPLHPRRLGELFIRPGTFFDPARPLGAEPELKLVVWCIGMFAVTDRIDQRLTGGSEGAGMVADSWLFLWLTVLLGGVLAGAVAWYVQGWWYRKRLEWSGAVDPDPDRVREVWAYMTFVIALPTVLGLVIQTLQFESYTHAWEEAILLPMIVLVAIFWSIATSYRAVRVNWKVREWPARFWFIGLPVTFYLFAIGVYSAIASLRT